MVLNHLLEVNNLPSFNMGYVSSPSLSTLRQCLPYINISNKSPDLISAQIDSTIKYPHLKGSSGPPYSPRFEKTRNFLSKLPTKNITTYKKKKNPQNCRWQYSVNTLYKKIKYIVINIWSRYLKLLTFIKIKHKYFKNNKNLGQGI